MFILKNKEKFLRLQGYSFISLIFLFLVASNSKGQAQSLPTYEDNQNEDDQNQLSEDELLEEQRVVVTEEPERQIEAEFSPKVMLTDNEEESEQQTEEEPEDETISQPRKFTIFGEEVDFLNEPDHPPLTPEAEVIEPESIPQKNEQYLEDALEIESPSENPSFLENPKKTLTLFEEEADFLNSEPEIVVNPEFSQNNESINSLPQPAEVISSETQPLINLDKQPDKNLAPENIDQSLAPSLDNEENLEGTLEIEEIFEPELEPLTIENETQRNLSTSHHPETETMPEFSKKIKPTIQFHSDSFQPLEPSSEPTPQTQNSESENPTAEEEIEPDPLYKIPPTRVEPEKVPPILTTMILNDSGVNHLTTWEVDLQPTFGDRRSTDFFVNGLYKLDAQVEQRLTQDNIFTSDFRGTYGQFKTIVENREIILTQSLPQTMIGFQQQLSFLGSCEDLNIIPQNPDSQCSFIPSLVVSRENIDPETFAVTRIDQLGNIGDEISPESLAIIQQPGFENRGVNGEVSGLDLYIPNAGFINRNDPSFPAEITREEDYDLNYALGIYNLRQIIKTNHEEAAIGRTIRGIGGITSDRNLGINTAVMGVAQLLPDLEPTLEGSENPTNTNVNRNLFLSANNTRIPSNSVTLYQGGTGYALHRLPEAEISPPANFNGVWLGLSPVTDRSFNTESRFVAVGPEIVIAEGGGEGGASVDISFITSFLQTNSGNSLPTVISSKDSQDFYSQIYLTFFQRDVNTYIRSILREETTFYPHISLTGNTTGDDHRFRYYGGAIMAEEPKLYVGADYLKDLSGWLFNLSSIVYLNSDQDYFSKVEGGVFKQFPLNEDLNAGVSAQFRYALDRDEDNFLNDPVDNFVGLSGSLNWGAVSLGLTKYFDILPESNGDHLQTNLQLNLGQLTLTGFYEPESNQNRFGATASYRFGNQRNSPFLLFSWNQRVFDFGNNLSTDDNTFTILLRLEGL